MKISGKSGPCIACGCTASPRGFEDAHIHSAGVRGGGKNSGRGCDESVNLLRLWFNHHRWVVHGVNGGWAALLEVARRAGTEVVVKARIQEADKHYEARCRGETECSKDSKVAWLARIRQKGAT